MTPNEFVMVVYMVKGFEYGTEIADDGPELTEDVTTAAADDFETVHWFHSCDAADGVHQTCCDVAVPVATDERKGIAESTFCGRAKTEVVKRNAAARRVDVEGAIIECV